MFGVIPIFRDQAPERVLRVLEALVATDVRAIELSASDDSTQQLLEQIHEQFADRFLLGVGTVYSSLTVAEMAAKEVKFIRSPNVNVHVIRATREHGLFSVPGAFTPTEVRAAADYGASVVDLFPAAALSPEFIETLRAVQPTVPLMASGGIQLHQVALYRSLGMQAIGTCRAFFEPGATVAEDVARIEKALADWE